MGMPSVSITKRTVDACEATDREQFYWDPDLKGFGLKVSPGGAKSYIIQYRMGGRGARTRRYTLGQHGSPWTPAAARAEAEQLLQQVKKGIDVLHAKRDRERQARDLAFKSYVTSFVDDYLKESWAASWADAKASLERHAVPILKDKPLPEISRHDIKAVLDRLKGKTATRRNLYAVLRRLFRWAVSAGDIDRSPIEGMEAPALPEKRDRVLSDHEVREVMIAAEDLGYPFGPLVKLLVLTGQRVEELGRANWREFDRKAQGWTIPKERAKNRQATEVPLSDAVIAILDGLARGDQWPRKGLLFTTTGKTPVSGYSRAKERLDKVLAKQAKKTEVDPPAEWRFHDLRRTLATGLQKLGVRFEVTEAILNHVSGSRAGVAGVYQRHDWKPEKRAALDAWATLVTSPADQQSKPDNVIRMRRL